MASTVNNIITIVSGLPRSGTSMMMHMLEAGGMPILTDNVRQADEDNPKGYYEFERVKQLEHDKAWLDQARGKAVKVVSPLLRHLPSNYEYRVIFMIRDLDEVLASQREMMIRRGEICTNESNEEMRALFSRHLAAVQAWLDSQPNFRVLYLDYHFVLTEPQKAAWQTSQFLDAQLDTQNMILAVDPNLYRQRRARTMK